MCCCFCAKEKQSPPENYRAINSITQLSKGVERYLHPFSGFVLEDNAFGQAQSACCKLHGARDAVVF